MGRMGRRKDLPGPRNRSPSCIWGALSALGPGRSGWGGASSFPGGTGCPWLGPTTSLSLFSPLWTGHTAPSGVGACPLGCEDMVVTGLGVSSHTRGFPSTTSWAPWPSWGGQREACTGDGRNVER